MFTSCTASLNNNSGNSSLPQVIVRDQVTGKKRPLEERDCCLVQFPILTKRYYKGCPGYMLMCHAYASMFHSNSLEGQWVWLQFVGAGADFWLWGMILGFIVSAFIIFMVVK
jgi:hypothetical protein